MRVAVVGVGAIGASWAALFAARAHDVIACDPRPEAADGLSALVGRAWPALERLGIVADGGSPDRIEFSASLEAAVDRAGFVQECAPERIELKRELYAQIDVLADPSTVIASSSSGLMATDLQRACASHPERVVIGHPFNPPHLVPLVEVVGGKATSADTIRNAIDFYRGCRKTPIYVRAELPGHVTNRLQVALWREAYWLVEQGVATVAEIDTAISSGPGLRWALLGPFATQHFSGGEGGMSHVMEHLGPPMAEWWSTLGTPRWGDELAASVVAGVDAELAGFDQPDVLATRDRLLEELIRAKAEVDLPGAS